MKHVLYTYTVSRVTYTDKYCACIWTSLGEFRYERYVITERVGHCDAWTQQSNNSCVTKRNPLSLLTVYRRIYGQ